MDSSTVTPSVPSSQTTKCPYTLTSGSHEAQGRRDTMEDTHKHYDDLKKESGFETLNNFNQIAYYAVFDGHGGDQTAKMVEKHLHPKIFLTSEFSKGDIQGALFKGFEEMDKVVVEEANKLNVMHGSTGVVGLVLDSKLYVANIGDSEGILVSVENGTVTPHNLTRAHKATDPLEKERIESQGGHVFFGRVFGALAVSRSFGDAKYKRPKTSKDFVSWEPDVKIMDLNTSHRFMILACDGLWDVMNHQQAAELACRAFLEGQNPQQVAQTLVKTALQRRTEDNVTVVVVKIQWEGHDDFAAVDEDSTPTDDSTESDEFQDEQQNSGQPSGETAPATEAPPSVNSATAAATESGAGATPMATTEGTSST